MGLTYTEDKQKELEEERPIIMEHFKFHIEFTFDAKIDVNLRQDLLGKFVEFGILTQPRNEFQTEILSMTFDTVDFNKYCSPHTDQVSLPYIFIQ